MKLNTRLALGDPHPHMGRLISSYQDGLATPEETDTVQRHLLECDACRAFYGGLQEVRALIGDLPSRGPDAQQLEHTFQAMLRRTGAAPQRPRPRK